MDADTGARRFSADARGALVSLRFSPDRSYHATPQDHRAGLQISVGTDAVLVSGERFLDPYAGKGAHSFTVLDARTGRTGAHIVCRCRPGDAMLDGPGRALLIERSDGAGQARAQLRPTR